MAASSTPVTETDTREQLLTSVSKVLAEAGGLGLSMGELAKRVGVSRPTLYYHFTDKSDIMRCLVEGIIDDAGEFMQRLDDTDFPTAREWLFELCRTRTLSIIRKRYNFQLLVYLDKILPESVRESHEALKTKVLKAHRDAIMRGMADGEFEPGDPSTSALAVIGIGNWAAWWFDERRGNPEETAVQLAELSIKSLLSAESGAQPMARRAQALKAIGTIEEACAELKKSLE